tara:strand:- start:2617 stop:3246 length:630 start_codon:yes stop_codon:yes gene_type:complete
MAKDRIAIKPSLILRGFGLQNLKTKLYDTVLGEEDQDPQAGVSYLGTPVFMNIEFLPSSYIDKFGKTVEYGDIVVNSDDDFSFKIDTVLVDVTVVKNVVKTNIQGVNGSVKEYISQGDYEIKLRGALVSENGLKYPELEVKQLREYMEVQSAVGIASRFLNDVFNVHNIVIESATFPQAEGTENVQLFEINAISDEPVELTVTGVKAIV